MAVVVVVVVGGGVCCVFVLGCIWITVFTINNIFATQDFSNKYVIPSTITTIFCSRPPGPHCPLCYVFDLHAFYWLSKTWTLVTELVGR